mmetsp:Transcript_41338/g.134125  ORF Transcript_41338/g.134125 Transcript_41338/m.134125 type:complete len:161 (+) Transcript_41338:95-577(+)
MLAAAKAVLAPRGTVRAAINMSNILLVTNRADPAQPGGVAPDMAAALADALGAKLQLVPYKNPGALADSAGAGEWDVGLIGAEPARAAIIGFSVSAATTTQRFAARSLTTPRMPPCPRRHTLRSRRRTSFGRACHFTLPLRWTRRACVWRARGGLRTRSG